MVGNSHHIKSATANSSSFSQIRYYGEVLTRTTTQLQPTTFLAFPSLSILQSPDHSPSFLLSST